MTSAARVRRRPGLFLRPEERSQLEFLDLLQGRVELHAESRWQALVPELGKQVVLDAPAMEAVLSVGERAWTPWAEAVARIGESRLSQLVADGLLEVAQADTEPSPSAGHWHPLSRMAHVFSRWSRDDVDASLRQAKFDAVAEMVESCGPPPPHFHHRPDAIARTCLAPPVRTALDELLERRATCRNFDLSAPLQQAPVSALLKRVFGVHGTEQWVPGAVALKKNHPSGGALHPVEAYLIVQRVVDLVPGLYHYNVQAHALDLLQELAPDGARRMATTAVAGQEYFADAPVQVVMAARFARSMWKYRNHPKIYRAIVLETGHISQNLYITATELGLGAFITAAINEVEIERAFGLEALAEGPLCVCGFGARAKRRTTVEFDPAHKVWPDG